MTARRILSLLLTLAAAALTGCASLHSVDEHFTAAPEELRVIDAPHIKWVTAVETRKICEALGSVAGQGSISETDHGCALFNRRLKSCTIFTKPDTSHSVLGHEMRHCFEGHFHEQKQTAQAAAAAPPSCKADPAKP